LLQSSLLYLDGQDLQKQGLASPRRAAADSGGVLGTILPPHCPVPWSALSGHPRRQGPWHKFHYPPRAHSPTLKPPGQMQFDPETMEICLGSHGRPVWICHPVSLLSHSSSVWLLLKNHVKSLCTDEAWPACRCHLRKAGA
jgi:hypothetical protein